jgi:hypothetical protein
MDRPRRPDLDLETAAEEGQLENPNILVKTIKDSVQAVIF